MSISKHYNSPIQQEYDTLGLPRFYKINNEWYDLQLPSDIINLPNKHISGEINGIEYCMDEILIKKAEQHFTQNEVDLRNAYMSKAIQIISSGNGTTDKAYVESYLHYDNTRRILYFINGKLMLISPAMKDDINYYSADYYDSDGVLYDISTVDGINFLPVPRYAKLIESLPSPTVYIEYILHRKAMGYSSQINSELAIAAFRKSNELMSHARIQYHAKDYMNYINYLLKCGLFENAETEKYKLVKSLPYIFSEYHEGLRLSKISTDNTNLLDTDLVEMTYMSGCCGLCAKYRGRIYSLSGNDKRFPKLPEQLLNRGIIHDNDCGISFYPFIYGISTPIYCEKDKEIEYSNRPFIDDRTPDEISNYNQRMTKFKQEKQLENDRLEYYNILYKMPILAPKSFNSYRKMKYGNTTNFQSLKDAALKHGILITAL